MPIVHCTLREGFVGANRLIGLDYLLKGGLLYCSGAVIYAERFPEKFLQPGAMWVSYLAYSPQYAEALLGIVYQAIRSSTCVRAVGLNYPGSDLSYQSSVLRRLCTTAASVWPSTTAMWFGCLASDLSLSRLEFLSLAI